MSDFTGNLFKVTSRPRSHTHRMDRKEPVVMYCMAEGFHHNAIIGTIYRVPLLLGWHFHVRIAVPSGHGFRNDITSFNPRSCDQRPPRTVKPSYYTLSFVSLLDFHLKFGWYGISCERCACERCACDRR